jgi:CBS domain-containing protein
MGSPLPSRGHGCRLPAPFLEEVAVQISQLLRHKGREVATIVGSESVRTALGVLADKGIGALVVSSDGRHVEGIVSERDVARGLHSHGAGLLAEPVTSLMTAEVHTCTPSSSVHDLAQTMTDHRVRHVPVVDDDGALIGIVSIGDVVKARLDELEDEKKHMVDYIQHT